MNANFRIRRPKLFTAVAVLVMAAAGVFAVRAAVTLAYFIAQGLDNSVRLTWETATELDNAGFYVRRSLLQNGSFNRISSFIPSRGDSLTGATYVFTDTNVVLGTLYWYQLETVDFSQNSQYYDPVSALPGSAAATQTAIASTPATATQTATATTTAATATRTPTATPQPTSTLAYPGPATSTPPVIQATQSGISGTAAPTGVETLSADATSSQFGIGGGDQAGSTATLIPLPEFTLEFATATPAAVAMAQQGGPQVPPAQSAAASGWLTPGRLLFLGFILLVWVILGVWFYLSMKRVQ